MRKKKDRQKYYYFRRILNKKINPYGSLLHVYAYGSLQISQHEILSHKNNEGIDDAKYAEKEILLSVVIPSCASGKFTSILLVTNSFSY